MYVVFSESSQGDKLIIWSVLGTYSPYSTQGLTINMCWIFACGVMGFTGLAMGSFNLLFMGGYVKYFYDYCDS